VIQAILSSPFCKCDLPKFPQICLYNGHILSSHLLQHSPQTDHSPWRWRQYISPKCQNIHLLHSVKNENMKIIWTVIFHENQKTNTIIFCIMLNIWWYFSMSHLFSCFLVLLLLLSASCVCEIQCPSLIWQLSFVTSCFYCSMFVGSRLCGPC